MLRAIPVGALVCALVALLNGVCWSIITPPFQAIDESAHFAYVQELVENGRLPSSGGQEYSPALEQALQGTRADILTRNITVRAISSRGQRELLDQDLARPASPKGIGDAGTAASEPPLYYAIATIPYELGDSGTILDRLELIRLMSALLAGITAFFCFMFVREALPGVPWAWTVGGLGVALTPLLGYMSGVNPDTLLYAECAALFYGLARAFRRGLTPRLGTAIGALLAAGFLTKLNFLGLLPGVLLALIVLTRRAAQISPRVAFRSLACTGVTAAVPSLLYVLINLASGRSGVNSVAGTIHGTAAHGSLTGDLSYIWQFYLPRLPGMHNDFPGLLPLRDIWFNRAVGRYGWLDTPFPAWVYQFALVPASLIIILCLRAMVISRVSLKRRSVEAIVYLLMGIGVLLLVGATSYSGFLHEGEQFGEPRYLLPMVALLGVLLALAARGAGRRWGPAVGSVLVVLVLAHDVFSQMLVISRFYG